MTVDQMRSRAQQYRNCGLETDALMIEACAALVDQAQHVASFSCREQLATLAQVPDETINRR